MTRPKIAAFILYFMVVDILEKKKNASFDVFKVFGLNGSKGVGCWQIKVLLSKTKYHALICYGPYELIYTVLLCKN